MHLKGPATVSVPPNHFLPRDNSLNTVVNSLELVANNAVQLLNAGGKTDGLPHSLPYHTTNLLIEYPAANALISQLQDLLTKAKNGSMSVEDASNAALQDISAALNA